MEYLPRAVVERALRARVRFLAGLLVLVFAGLGVRLYTLQLAEGDWYAAQASAQQLRDTIVPAPRGEIFSADGALLATSATCWTVRASPREMADADVEKAAAGLAEILQLDEAGLLAKFSKRKSNDCLVQYRVDRPAADRVRNFCAENGIDGIHLNPDTRRYYPQGELLASVLGFTNVDNVGMSGLELEYNTTLTGRKGRVLTASNAWGYPLAHPYAAMQPPVQGHSLTLTIDLFAQKTLENALRYAVKEHSVGQRAVGIVMEPATGKVLAMCTTPAYDPNQPRVIYDEAARAAVDALAGDDRRAALQLAQQTQWRNKAVSDLYEPGSVFKLITCAAGLDAGAAAPDSTFFCGKSIKVAGIPFHCANHKKHGPQTLTQALMNSCNQSFIQVGQRLGKQSFYDYFAAFGLCRATGIDLPAEPKKSEYYTPQRMGPVELASCSFGQSSKISYIQMAAAVCAVVNGGQLMRPYLVSDIHDSQGRVVRRVQPTPVRQVIRPETSAAMRAMMEQVVAGGTGRRAQVAGYRIGGKSGTSQKLDSENEKARIASFVAVAPADAPRYLVLVCLDEPHSWSNGGGALSAPVCAQVLEALLERDGTPRQQDPPKEQ